MSRVETIMLYFIYDFRLPGYFNLCFNRKLFQKSIWWISKASSNGQDHPIPKNRRYVHKILRTLRTYRQANCTLVLTFSTFHVLMKIVLLPSSHRTKIQQLVDLQVWKISHRVGSFASKQKITPGYSIRRTTANVFSTDIEQTRMNTSMSSLKVAF